MRGFLSGIIWGGIVAALAVAALSIVTDLPERDSAALPTPVSADAPPAETPAPPAETGTAPAETPAPADSAPQISGAVPDQPAEPGAGGSGFARAPLPSATPDTPQVVVPDSARAATPEADRDPGAQPQAETGAVSLGDPGAGGDSAVSVAGDQPVAATPPSQAPQPPLSENDLSISTDPAQPAPPADPAEDSAFPADPGQEDIAALPMPDEGTGEPQAEPAARQPAGTVGNLADNVAVNRLPSAGATEGTEASAPGAARPFERFAEPVAEPGDKPRMAIVLIDNGASGLDPSALEGFPYPVSVAVDAAWDGAGAAMAAYRAMGLEVMALVDLPQAANASDAEIGLAAALGRVPEAVAVMEGDDTGLQGNRALSDQVATVLGETGHGLLLFANGLDTARKLAAREGVPSATVFRDFDSNNQSPTVIRRFLEQAAFRAGQEGAVVMVGRLRADTISALLLWGLQDRATRVALVPVSQVLSTTETGQ